MTKIAYLLAFIWPLFPSHWWLLLGSSTCTNTKHSTSNLNIPNEEQAEGKPTPTDLPPDTLPPLEGTTDSTVATNEPQDKEKVKKTKNNKGGKAENASANSQESSPPAGSQKKEDPELNNKKHSFRNQYARLPANLPMRSAACTLLWDASNHSSSSLNQTELLKALLHWQNKV